MKMNNMYCGNGFPNLPDFDAMEAEGGGASAGLIAYEQKTLKADQAYTAGDNFIYDGTIYVATSNIAKDADIVLEGAGANAEALDPVQEQINDIKEDIADIEASIPVPWDYSTTEVETGQKWGNDKIYCKLVETSSISTGANQVAHGITGLDHVIAAQGYVSTTSQGDLPLNVVAAAAADIVGIQRYTDTNIVLYIGTNYAGGYAPASAKIALFYTKSAEE